MNKWVTTFIKQYNIGIIIFQINSFTSPISVFLLYLFMKGERHKTKQKTVVLWPENRKDVVLVPPSVPSSTGFFIIRLYMMFRYYSTFFSLSFCHKYLQNIFYKHSIWRRIQSNLGYFYYIYWFWEKLRISFFIPNRTMTIAMASLSPMSASWHSIIIVVYKFNWYIKFLNSLTSCEAYSLKHKTID